MERFMMVPPGVVFAMIMLGLGVIANSYVEHVLATRYWRQQADLK